MEGISPNSDQFCSCCLWKQKELRLEDGSSTKHTVSLQDFVHFPFPVILNEFQFITREFFREIASFISRLLSFNKFFPLWSMNLFATDVGKKFVEWRKSRNECCNFTGKNLVSSGRNKNPVNLQCAKQTKDKNQTQSRFFGHSGDVKPTKSTSHRNCKWLLNYSYLAFLVCFFFNFC